MLAVTLRWLAGASYLDLCLAWGISCSTFYHPKGVLWPMLEAIDAVFDIGFPFNDASALEVLLCSFWEYSFGVLDGCVLAIDGFGVSTWQLFETEVLRPKDYRFRKGGFAIVVLVGCDVKARFICTSWNHSGSINNFIAWYDSKLFHALEVDCQLPPQPSSLTYSGCGLDRFKDSFNYFLSHSRQAVDNAFGMLTQRWGIYWCVFHFLFDHWPLVVLCTMKWYNLCIDHGVDVPLHQIDHDVLEGDVWHVNDNAREDAIVNLQC